jgi:hypothetical protein
VLNFSKAPATYTLPAGTTAGELVLANVSGTEQHSPTLHLGGWEARVYKQ